VHAQNVAEEANYGSIELTGFFTPDPYTVEIIAGGSIEANAVTGCSGYISEAPDLELDFSDPSLQLSFFVTSDTDTTLIVNDPSGNWHCNDDFDSASGTNPGVVFSQPDAGVYDIWVGTYSENEAFESANLHITELGAPWDANSSSANTSLDPLLEANFGNIDLEGLFEPDPYQRSISAGGTVDASTIENCAGYVSSAPDLQLDFSNPSDYGLNFFVESSTDTTLVINGPTGDWHCNDDFGSNSGTNPGIVFSDPDAGIYDIWVGTYSEGDAFSEVELYITELGAPWDGSSSDSSEATGSGTGFVVSTEGHILTNHHVIDSCVRQTFQIRGSAAVDATVLSSNAATDLALLSTPISVMPATFSGTQSVRLGDEVVVFGFPLAGDLSSQGNLTNGIVSALSGLDDDLSRLQMTAQIQPGNSGGPVMNRRGEIVGVVVETANDEFFREQRGTDVQNLNFAIRDYIATSFLETNNVNYETSPSESADQSIADIAEAAQQFTGIIMCYR
tara:strand:+ start:2219 stop:3733 length:1515 start_codon:yes stop_codon:yes gene_type:complete